MLHVVMNIRVGILLVGAFHVWSANGENGLSDAALLKAREALVSLNGKMSKESGSLVEQNLERAAIDQNRNEIMRSTKALDDATQHLEGVVISDQVMQANLKKMRGDIEKLTKQFATQLQAPENSTGDPQLLIFVSQSIPIKTLKRLAFQAEQAGVPLVFRGFVDNSMRSTLLYFKQLMGDEQKTNNADRALKPTLRLMIDPLLFERYGVDQVPAFTVIRQGQRCIGPTAHCKGDVPEHMTVSGDVSLGYAVESLQRLAPNFSNELAPVSQRLKIQF